MARRNVRATIVVAGVAAALAAASVLIGLPPPRANVAGRWAPEVKTARVRGTYHVHTTRSDGTGTVEEVARAAGRARLDFVILTDHGDGTRVLDAPRMIDNVLVIDAVEVSTRLGHLTALGLRTATPYRLAGWPDDVVEDLRRWGGLAIAAHPDSPRHSLSWRAWHVPVAGLEWLSADSAWRDESLLAMARTLASYPWRPVESIAALFDRPRSTLDRWDAHSREGRFLFAVAGADAHARLGVREDEEDPDPSRWVLKLPGYEQVFRAFSTVVELDAPFTREPDADARRLVAAIGAGRSYTVIDGLATPGRLEFVGRQGDRLVRMGERVAEGPDLALEVRTLAPAGATIRVLRNGEIVASSTGLALSASVSTALGPGERGAAFRVEVAWPDEHPARVPWILSNPIFVQPAAAPEPDAAPVADPVEVAGIDLRSCMIERDAVSTAAVTAEESGDRLVLRFQLAEARESWVAVGCAVPRPLHPGEGVRVGALASRPLRMDLQLREEGTGDRRWSRSLPVDRAPGSFTVWADSLRPVSDGLPPGPGDRPVRLLFVIDRTQGVAGMDGVIEIERLRLIAPAGPAGESRAPGAAGTQVRTVSSR